MNPESGVAAPYTRYGATPGPQAAALLHVAVLMLALRPERFSREGSVPA